MKTDKRKEDCNSSEGIITQIDGNKLTVKISEKETCQGCAAANLCEKTSDKGKVLNIEQNNADNFSVGEKVSVNTPQSKVMQAVMLAFGYPVLIIVAMVLICAYVFAVNEIILAVSILVVLSLYFFILYKLRHKDLFKFSIYIDKLYKENETA